MAVGDLLTAVTFWLAAGRTDGLASKMGNRALNISPLATVATVRHGPTEARTVEQGTYSGLTDMLQEGWVHDPLAREFRVCVRVWEGKLSGMATNHGRFTANPF